MAVYVRRNGVLVEKTTGEPMTFDPMLICGVYRFPTPMVSRMEPYESPVTGKEITSWGERDREMKANDAYDPRDVSKPYRRGRQAQAKEAQEGVNDSGFEWRDPA